MHHKYIEKTIKREAEETKVEIASKSRMLHLAEKYEWNSIVSKM